VFNKSEASEVSDAIADAAISTFSTSTWGLNWLIKSSGIRGFAETGEMLNARISSALLSSIFYPDHHCWWCGYHK